MIGCWGVLVICRSVIRRSVICGSVIWVPAICIHGMHRLTIKILLIFGRSFCIIFTYIFHAPVSLHDDVVRFINDIWMVGKGYGDGGGG